MRWRTSRSHRSNGSWRAVAARAPDRAGTRNEERGRGGQMADRIVLRGGHVITVDPALGDIAGGDALIEGDTIAAVGRDLSADAEVIDCSGSVVIPGFVDTHRHTWEAAI